MVQSNWFRRIFVEGKRDRIPGIDTQPKTFSSAYLEGREEILAKAMQSADLESKVSPSPSNASCCPSGHAERARHEIAV